MSARVVVGEMRREGNDGNGGSNRQAGDLLAVSDSSNLISSYTEMCGGIPHTHHVAATRSVYQWGLQWPAPWPLACTARLKLEEHSRSAEHSANIQS
jgi:hypothetical protein